MDNIAEAPRYVNLLGATGEIRVGTFQKRSHLVVPVVALVEGVLHPANTAQPEFVPADVIGQAPQGWNGRPVVVGHPQINNEFVSANSPEILESSIGLLFNSEFKNGKLSFEAWIDEEKASVEGTESHHLLSNIKDNKMIEVSVGALVATDKKPGQHKGKSYSARWKSIVPDHLAFLRDGDKGACNNDAGCGAPRVAAMHVLTANGFEVVGESNMPDEVTTEEIPKRTLRERLLSLMTFKSNMNEEDMSDRDLRNALERSLASEPGFLGVDSVFPNEEKVIYAVATAEKILLFSRDYSFSKGEVKLGSKKEEVQPVTRFESVNAQSPGCGCGHGGGTMDKAQRVKTLIESGRFKETDRPWLEQIPDDRLETIEATPPAAAPAPAPAAEPPAATVAAQAPAPPAAVTAEQYISAAPPELQESLREGLRVQQERRAEITTALKATSRCDFSDQQLAGMPTDQLERLLKLADVPPPPSFVGRLNVRSREPEGVPPAPTLQSVIKANRERA